MIGSQAESNGDTFLIEWNLGKVIRCTESIFNNLKVNYSPIIRLIMVDVTTSGYIWVLKLTLEFLQKLINILKVYF